MILTLFLFFLRINFQYSPIYSYYNIYYYIIILLLFLLYYFFILLNLEFGSIDDEEIKRKESYLHVHHFSVDTFFFGVKLKYIIIFLNIKDIM